MNIFEQIKIGSSFDAKGFKQAETATQKLNSSVKSLAKTFGVAFSTAAIIGYGKASVKAFIEDDNAARSLGITLKNLGLETGNTSVYVNEMISNLEKQTGVLDDQLRPAMDRLLRATSSVSKATTLLNLALDISAGTGKDLTTVSQGLQKAYLGNNASLGRLGVGLSKAELTSSSFEEIQIRLSELFAGQASSAAESYAGQLNKLTIAGNNAKEVIGKGIVQALTESSGSVNAASSDIERYSTAISNLIVDFGRFIRLSNAVPTIFELLTDPVAAIKNYNKVADAIDAQIKKQNSSSMGKNPIQSGAYLNKAQLTVNKATLKVSKENLKLAKAKAIFDLQKIQIEAALKGKISEEEKIRLLLMKAIAEENMADIEKYTKMLDKVQGKVTDLQDTLAEVYAMDAGNPFISWEIGLDGVQRALIEINGQSIELTNTLAQNSLAMGLLGGASFAQALSGARYAAQAAAQAGITGTLGNLPVVPSGGGGGGGTTTTTVTVNVAGTVTAQADLEKAIQDAINSSNASGTSNILAPKTWRGEV